MSSCAKYTMWFPSPLVVFSADSSGKYLHACLSPATWSVHWSWWWRRTTWSCTWTEPRPTGGCPASVGWRNAIRWLTEGERRRSAAERRSATMPPSDVRSCACLQAQEELEILHYSASVVVHQDDSSCHQALHQVKRASPFHFQGLWWQFNGPAVDDDLHVQTWCPTVCWKGKYFEISYLFINVGTLKLLLLIVFALC